MLSTPGSERSSLRISNVVFQVNSAIKFADYSFVSRVDKSKQRVRGSHSTNSLIDSISTGQYNHFTTGICTHTFYTIHAAVFSTRLPIIIGSVCVIVLFIIVL